MKRFVFLALLTSAVVIAPCSVADDKGSSKPSLPNGTPAEQVKELIAQHEKAAAVFRKLLEAANTEEEEEKVAEAHYPDQRPYADLLWQIAEKNPKDPAAVDALIWAYRYTRSDKAKTILIRDHLLHPKIGPFCLALQHELDLATLTALKKVLDENPSTEAQAQAAVALAIRLKKNAKMARELQKANEKALPEWEKRFGKEIVAGLTKADASILEQEAEELLERVIKDNRYASTTIPFGDDTIKLGTLATRELFEIRQLQPGKVAPDIVGEDIDGRPMKLSDFRGKVVLLDFWGFWCGPCVAMNEHGRSLVKKLEGKPFVIVGVNSDSDREKVKAMVDKKGTSWRSFWDGGSPNGPIQNQWNIRAFPTMYLIDHKGVIVGRAYPLPVEGGIDLIERTVQMAEADRK